MSNDAIEKALYFVIGLVSGGFLAWAWFGDYKPPKQGGWRNL